MTDKTRPTFNLFLEELFKTKRRQSCEIILSDDSNSPTYVYLTGIANEDGDKCLMTMVDISNQKKAEENLIKTQLLLQSTLESQNDTIIFSIDTNYNYLTFNKVHSNVMKKAYNSDVKVGMNILECISSIEDRTIAKENYDRALRGESHSNIRVFGDIEKAYYESFFYPIVDDKNTIIGATGLARNITKRIQNQNDLKLSEEKYRTLFETNRDSITIFRIDTDGNPSHFIETNPAATTLYGYTKKELLELNVEDIEIDSDEKRKDRLAILLNIDEINYETSIKTKKGNFRNVEIKAQLIQFLNEPAVMNISRDITERKKTEEKIRQLSLAVEQSPITIVITNTLGEIEYANPKFIETTGYTLMEVMGQNPRFLKSGHTSQGEYKELWQTIADGKEWHGEFYNKKKDGSFYWESASISPIKNTEGKTTHFIAFKEDITNRKNVEKELIISKERAEESDRLKLAFLANMSHEIRTPMNGILGFTELLKAPQLSGEEQQEFIKIIEESGKRMLNIINDIISISKLESGKIEVSLTETNIKEQIEYIHTFFKPEAKQKGIQLLISKELAFKDNFIKTDREKVYAVLTNLVKNALKFTNEGSIEFGCEKKGDSLEFFIKDTGMGISKSQKKIIFERFRQASETISRTHEGSGLGLAISKAYVEILGGKIWVESEEGKGSIFYFTIPFLSENKLEENAIAKKMESVVEEENKIKDLKVLIVEDDAISKLLITFAVKPFSKEILQVSTGSDAIDACRNNPDIDLVLMDINMPEMDGYKATKLIRKFNKDLVIIAQTANGMQSDRDEAIAAGCTDYISKPINIKSLSDLIRKYFEK